MAPTMKENMVKNISYISIEDAETPRDGEVLTNRWWVYDPEKGLLVWKREHYQCNRDRRITEGIQKSLYPDLKVRYMKVVYTGQWRELV